MAPRRGGGGYSSGGSSSCYYCLEPMVLPGFNWMMPTTTALFAMYIIAMVVLIVCLILTRRFKWIRERGSDKLRNSGYTTAAFFMFSNYLLAAIFQGLGESEVVVTYMVYLGYMIKEIFGQVALVLIVAIIARTITEDVGAVSQKICTFAVALLWVITIVGLGFDIAYFAEYMAIGGPELIAVSGTVYTAITLASYLLAFTLYLFALSVYAVLKRSSVGTLLMLIVVVPALFLMTLIDLVKQAILNFSTSFSRVSSFHLYYASAFITVLATMAIFLTVAIIGGIRQRHSDANGVTHDPKFAQPGPHYVAVGPYAPPPAPYNPHGTQLADGQVAQPFQYSPPQYGQAGQQQMQYAPYPAAGVAKTVSPVADSPAPYGAPSSSSASPPPPHDPYQMHMQQQQPHH
ncbi:hypothetical protein VE03_09647 [Pseudogymnoascus sp. 23342-1-I1]|nr:hypothetical protein VE03_09647 [Pseudogymnoascus sp. 23342-1-I1]